MKCVVIYFSQTGNTEKVAYAIQAGVKQAAGHCDIAKIKDVNPKGLHDYDLIGIGSAVFGGTLGSVATLLNDLRFVGGKHAFFFCTHGSAARGGNFFPTAYERAKKSGLVIIGRGDWYGDCYLLHMPEPYPTAGHPDDIDLREAEEFGREMVMRSWKMAAGATNLVPPEPKPMEMPPGMARMDMRDRTSGELFDPRSYSKLLKFHNEKCLAPKCRLCMDNCPVDGIDLSVDPPILAKPCLSCEFCARLCPTGALDIDEWVEGMATMSYKGITRGPIQLLEQAEADGLFRRLAPGKNPDEYYADLDNYGYQKHKQHPQWVIGKGPQ
jgi:flavodoxin/ferredoxin